MIVHRLALAALVLSAPADALPPVAGPLASIFRRQASTTSTAAASSSESTTTAAATSVSYNLPMWGLEKDQISRLEAHLENIGKKKSKKMILFLLPFILFGAFGALLVYSLDTHHYPWRERVESRYMYVRRSR